MDMDEIKMDEIHHKEFMFDKTFQTKRLHVH
jgi:hypothetical protein